MNRPQTAAESKLIHEHLTEQVIGAAIEVHKALGPGLLESVYEECLCHELHLSSLRFQRQVTVPVIYKGVALDCGYRLDLIVEDTVILELKSIDRVLPIHEAQLLTYLKLLEKPVGFLFNFNVPALGRGGIIRKVFDSASPRLRGEKAFAAGMDGSNGRE
jgi:GxxExxY protein